MRYKLIDAVLTPISFNVRTTGTSGDTRYRRIRLEPGKLYETDDKVMYESLLEAEERVRFTPQKEQALQGTSYRKEACKSCGGRVLKLIYHPVTGVSDAVN